ncbi:MAG: prepilin-type N-terminal cleavage/methylation domain-containing protein [Candidatus Portnoybacteria bacterium]|nr:prepilin-type N-terminal cleavage/methylation domain-containing protein [Candidatus Portnoybacteria bacterium]
MSNLLPSHSCSRGFTLLELMIAVAIFGIASAAIYATYQHQQDSYLIQEQVADMQQNLRAGMYFLTRGIKMAGYDPTGKAGAAAHKANSAKKAEFNFAVDEDRDGKIINAEIIRYALSKDANKDGRADAFPCNLGRADGAGGLQPLAENVEALEFFYHLADGTTATDPANPADVRSVDVSLLVRTQYQIKGHRDTIPYFPASNPKHETGEGKTVWGPFNDGLRRKLLITNVQCRNLGLK